MEVFFYGALLFIPFFTKFTFFHRFSPAKHRPKFGKLHPSLGNGASCKTIHRKPFSKLLSGRRFKVFIGTRCPRKPLQAKALIFSFPHTHVRVEHIISHKMIPSRCFCATVFLQRVQLTRSMELNGILPFSCTRNTRQAPALKSFPRLEFSLQ